MEHYLQFTFPVSSIEQSDTLLAALSDLPFEGFEEADGELRAFMAEEHFSAADLDAAIAGLEIPYSTTVIDKINWNAKWELEYEPVIVDDFAGVRAFFHEPLKQVKHDIVITPKMSFGTGHHATTYLMIEQMRNIDFAGKKVFDFGTGTGILAILACKLGAAQVTGIDIDDWSIENAAENITQNSCTNIHIYQSGTLPENELYDVILANINLHVITETLETLKSMCAPGGRILISGFLKQDTSLPKYITTLGLEMINLSIKGEWVSILLVV